MNRLESQKIPKHWNIQFQYMKRTFSSGETHSFIQWNAQFQVLKLCWNSYSKNHTYAYDNLNRLIKANGKAKSASYEMTMTFGRMSEPLTKVQKVDSTKTAQSYDFTYKYEDSNHPTTPTQIGYEHYTYDANGNPTLVENDSLNSERRMYWDEDNRLMVLSDNGKTSRYTYNAAGERIIKSHGDLEGVYINGAPQGITFHETEDYTIYPAPIITVTKNRFTKHYFIGDKRIASKLGVGKFSNVYGISGNNVTAGQKDYAARMMQIEKQREEYYKSLGTPPGVPTMKGATADPDNTGYGYNTIIGELGDHSVPEGWVKRTKFNDKGDVPGPPVQWNKPEDPDNAQPGYGYIPTDTTNIEDIFFYHNDHLGSTSYITDANANITQFDAYLPYGELLVDEHSSSEDMPYKFNGKELDQETGLYYYGARYMNPVTSLWYGMDALTEKYPSIGGYVYCVGNPVKLIDPDGKDVFIWYKDKHGRDQLFRFSGFHGKKSIKIPNNQYVKDFIQAYLYNAKHGGGKRTIQAVTNHKYKIYVSDSQNDETYYSGGDRQPTVYWESRQGLITTEGGKQSAATALEHEMDHAVDDANNHKQHVERRQRGDSNYDNMEERRVITGSEAHTAKGNKEAVRRNHRGKNYRTVSPTSTTPSK